ncbi:MAG: Phosphoribosylformylglycinamidine synthase, PurS subunit, partial [uncultured Frankineae bacterium]
ARVRGGRRRDAQAGDPRPGRAGGRQRAADARARSGQRPAHRQARRDHRRGRRRGRRARRGHPDGAGAARQPGDRGLPRAAGL